MPRNTGPCCIENCNGKNELRGYCKYHYHHLKNKGDLKKIQFGDKRNHPLYILWWQRKIDNYLCAKWLDFYEFVKDVSPKPEGNYLLVRLRNELFGPDNFKWQEHLKRKEGEANKDWWARKRVARIAANPSMESDRNIKRVFGLTRDSYNDLLKEQDGVCAICRKPETAIDGKTGTLKKLAVDHCHNSKKIRELLCWRCNGTLGKVNDNVELLQAMIDYLNKHKEA